MAHCLGKGACIMVVNICLVSLVLLPIVVFVGEKATTSKASIIFMDKANESVLFVLVRAKSLEHANPTLRNVTTMGGQASSRKLSLLSVGSRASSRSTMPQTGTQIG